MLTHLNVTRVITIRLHFEMFCFVLNCTNNETCLEADALVVYHHLLEVCFI